MRWDRDCGQACDDNCRVGERAKEGLVDGLNGLSMMLVWELYSGSVPVCQCACGTIGEWWGGMSGEGS